METIFIGKNCIEVEKTDSTSSYLTRLLTSTPPPLLNERGIFEGTVVFTNNQEQGRGQRGATWESEPNKNLTLSILLQPAFLLPDEQFQLNKAISLGVMEFVTSCLTPPKESCRTTPSPIGEGSKIKWPNDIYIGNKKVAGILIENLVSGSTLQQSIVGIGINVNQEKFSSKLPNPISLKLAAAGKEFALSKCLAELCSCIERRYLQLRSPTSVLSVREEGRQTAIDADYLKNLYRFGKWASYKYNGEIIKAKIIGATKIGKLKLETDKGKTVECNFKEVEYC